MVTELSVQRLLPNETFSLGEGPVWDDRTAFLYWVDIKAPSLNAFNPITNVHRTWHWQEPISSCGLAESGAVLVVGRSGIWRFDPEDNACDLLFSIGPLKQDMRTNDSKIGPDGAFWVSTMLDKSDRGPSGVLLRVSLDGASNIVLDGLTTPNGIEWSPDGRTFYLSDTRELWVDCWDFAIEAGTLSNRRRFANLKEGKPDGAAVDRDGGYWVAGIYSGSVHRYQPDGKLQCSVSIPSKMVTCPCFGGPDLKTLFITSLSSGPLGPKEDGGLYAVETSVVGLPARRMAI